MNPSRGKVLLSVAAMVVLGAIVGGVAVVGGPDTGRLECDQIEEISV